MRPAVFALAVLLSACAGRKTLDLSELPDDPVRSACEPVEALELGAAQRDPTVRGTSLGALVAHRDASELTRWLMQATYDPEPTVQRAAAEGLLSRLDDPGVEEAVRAYALRRSADPYVRLDVVRGLLAQGRADGLHALREVPSDTKPWQRVPLHLLAGALGAPVDNAWLGPLADGAVRDDPTFLAALAQGADTTALDVMADAVRLSPEALEVPYGLVGVLAGHPGLTEVWTRALRRSGSRWAVEWLVRVPAQARSEVTSGRPDDPEAQRIFDLIQRPSAASWKRAATSEDPWTRVQVARLAVDAEPTLRDELLAALVDDPEPRVREAAISVARDPAVGVPVASLVRAAGSDKPSLRAVAYAALYARDWTPEGGARACADGEGAVRGGTPTSPQEALQEEVGSDEDTGDAPDRTGPEDPSE